MKHKILVVDDHVMLRAGLRQALALRPNLVLVGEASNGTEALRLVEELKPDLLILDIYLPDIDGIEVSRRVLGDHPEIKIIIFSSDTDHLLVERLLEIGISGYLSKTSSMEELVFAIDATMAGKLYLTPDVSRGVLADYRKVSLNETQELTPVLSDREKELLRMVAQGHRNKEIASAWNRSIKAVESIRSRLMKKLRCTSSAELVRYAIAQEKGRF